MKVVGCCWNRLNNPVFVAALLFRLTSHRYFEKKYAACSMFCMWYPIVTLMFSGTDMGHPAHASGDWRPHPCLYSGRRRDQPDSVGCHPARLDCNLLQKESRNTKGLKADIFRPALLVQSIKNLADPTQNWVPSSYSSRSPRWFHSTRIHNLFLTASFLVFYYAWSFRLWINQFKRSHTHFVNNLFVTNVFIICLE